MTDLGDDDRLVFVSQHSLMRGLVAGTANTSKETMIMKSDGTRILSRFMPAFLAGLGLFLLILSGCGDDSGSGSNDAAVQDAANDAQTSDSRIGDSGTGQDGTMDGQTSDGGNPNPQCGTITTFEDGKTPTAEVHVATTGSDTNGNGTRSNPYATIERAVQDAVPGTSVIVHQGTYPGGISISNLAGSQNALIWIGGAQGENEPIIDATGHGEAMHLSNTSYLVIHDLEMANSDDNGINCDDGGDMSDPQATHHIIFRNLFLHDVGGDGNQDCLKLSGLNHFFVLDSEITHCGGNASGSAIDEVGCHHGLIARNFMHDLSANAVQNKGGTEDVEIRWNKMVHAGVRAVNMGGSTGFQYFRPPLSETQPNAEARDIRVLANVIEGSTAALAFVGCVDCVAAHNTIVDPDRWILRILQETTSSGSYTFEPCKDNLVENNIFYFDRSQLHAFINIGPNTAGDTFTFTANLWYAHDNPGQSQPDGLPVTENQGIYGQDPAFADPSSEDFHITTSSPAAGAGAASSPLLTGDMDGHCYQDPPAIGAYEAP